MQETARTFGPCTRCGAPITWHNGLFLCPECFRVHYTLRNLLVRTLDCATRDEKVSAIAGEKAVARWAGYTIVEAGECDVRADKQGFWYVCVQAVWPFDEETFVYAEVRRLSGDPRSDRTHRSIQLVNIAKGDRKEAITRATRGFDLLDFYIRRGGEGRPKKSDEQFETDFQELVACARVLIGEGADERNRLRKVQVVVALERSDEWIDDVLRNKSIADWSGFLRFLRSTDPDSSLS